VAAATKIRLDVVTQGCPLEQQHVRQVLVMKSRSARGIRHVHPEVDNVRHDLSHRRHDGGAAWRAGHELDLPVAIEQNDRRHRRQHALSRLNRVRLALHQAELIRRARLRRKVVHLVVQQEPGSADRNEVPVQRVERRGYRDGVSGRVDD
jgi:hypothetical protein